MTQEPDRTTQEWWEDQEQRSLLEQRFMSAGMSRRALLGLIGAFASGAAVIACGGGTKEETKDAAPGTSPATGAAQPGAGEKLARQQILRTRDSSEGSSFDYNKDLYADTSALPVAMLLQFDEEYNVKPDMAESYTANDRGDVYTFKMRRDTKWSNGDPVTARDFEWSWKRNLDPATRATYAGFLFDIKNAEPFNSGQIKDREQVGVKAVDDYTLEVTLEGPRGYFPILAAYIAAAPAHRPSVEKFGERYGVEADTMVGNGPFKVTKWEKGKVFELAKNEGYWNAGNIKLERIVTQIIAQEASLAAYENNEIDFIDRGNFGDLKRIQADPKLSKEIFKFSPVGTWYLMPNPLFKPFDLKEVRLAMAHAIDREKIAKEIFQGLSEPAYTMNPPGTPGYNQNKYDQFTKFEGKNAINYLRGTPYEGGRNWPKITLTQRVETDADATAAQAIIQMLKDNLGMTDIEHEIGPAKPTYEKMFEGRVQLMWVRWYMDYPDQNNFNWDCFTDKKPKGSRRSWWDNAEYNRIVDAAKGEKDQEKRKQMYYQSDEILAGDAGAIFVHYPLFYGLQKPWVKGMPMNKASLPVPAWNIFIRMADRLYIVEH